MSPSPMFSEVMQVWQTCKENLQEGRVLHASSASRFSPANGLVPPDNVSSVL